MSKWLLRLSVVLAIPVLAHSADQIVGVNAPSGGVTLAKRVHVLAGTEVARIELVSNDLSTVYPAVRLRRLSGRQAGEIVSEVRNLSADGPRHRFAVSIPPVVFLQDEDILIEIALPPDAGADRRGHGAGLAANNLDGSEVTSYIGNAATGELQPIDVDLCVSILGPAVAGKAEHSPPDAEPPLEAATSLSLSVRNRLGGDIEVHLTSPAAAVATVEIYDVRGSLVRTLASRALVPGEHILSWNRLDERRQRIAAGVYFIAVRVGDTGTIRKTVVLH